MTAKGTGPFVGKLEVGFLGKGNRKPLDFPKRLWKEKATLEPLAGPPIRKKTPNSKRATRGDPGAIGGAREVGRESRSVSPGLPKKSDTRIRRRKKRKRFRRRSAIEPVIGHLKAGSSAIEELSQRLYRGRDSSVAGCGAFIEELVTLFLGGLWGFYSFWIGTGIYGSGVGNPFHFPEKKRGLNAFILRVLLRGLR